MISFDAAIQIRSLRAQLDVLEARLRVRQPQTHSLADLRGILEHETPTSAQEIDAVKYRGSQSAPGMTYVLDTHSLVWHLENNSSLSPRASAILASPDSEIVIPSIVLAELWHLFQRKRIKTSPTEIRSRILSAANCSVYPLDEAVLELLPPGLEIHDAIIVGTCLVYRDVIGQPTQLITRDQRITDSHLIDIVW